MNQQLISLASISMDLKRAAMGFYNGSKVGNRFLQEAVKRKKEINFKKVDSYIVGILNKMETKEPDDLLMYSTLLQNYVTNNTKV